MIKNNIPIVILCGGYGSRLGAEGEKKPKALIEIGGKPIIFHLIEFFQKQSFQNIYLATGYKHKSIENFINKKHLNKNVKVINTGLKTMTGGRVLRLKKYLNKYNKIIVTYGDGLSNINLEKLIKYHNNKKALCTITAVKPFSNFGELFLDSNNRVKKMSEKEHLSNRWINGGFIVLENAIFNFIKNDQEILEKTPLTRIAKQKKLFAYKHHGFWKCLDNNKDKIEFNNIMKKKKKIWLK